jgi:MFS family permease
MCQETSINSADYRPENTLRYEGWRVVLACHLGVLVGFATVFIYSFSLMVKPLQHEFGWNRQQIAQAFSLAAISVAICSPFMGKLFDRFEPRRIIALFMACFGAGVASLAWLTTHLAQFYLTAVFIGIAGSGTYQLGYARVVAGWFEQRLGMALSIVVAGSGVGSFVVPPLVQHLIASYGWRDTYLILAALPLLIGVPLTLRFARSSSAHSNSKRPERTAEAEYTDANWRQALAARSFWLLMLGVCCISLSENGALAHLAPMLNDRAIKPADAALIVSILGASSLAGRLLLGWLLDYLEGSHIATFSMLAAGGGIFLLAHAQSFHTAAPAALIAGLGMGCELDLIPYMLRRYFGMRSFSTLYGAVYSGFAVSGALAPLLLGYLYDRTGSYTGILSVFSSITAIMAFGMLLLPAYRYSVQTPTTSIRQTDDSISRVSSPLIPDTGASLEGN